MSPTDVEEFLWLLRDNPDLLLPAPNPCTPGMMTRRTIDEVHPCVKCGQLAEWVFVADSPVHPEAGNRWVDLCGDHMSWLRAGLEDLAARDRATKQRVYFRPDSNGEGTPL